MSRIGQKTGRHGSGDRKKMPDGIERRPYQERAGCQWRVPVLPVLLLLTILSSVQCHRQKAAPAGLPGISEKEKNERVFKTNEEAVLAGIYEEFVDSMRLGAPGSNNGREVRSGHPEKAAQSSGPTPVAPGAVMGFRVQLGAFNRQEDAENFAVQARGRVSSCQVYVRYYHPLWKVQAGDCAAREGANRLRAVLRSRGYPDAWVVSSGINR